MARFGLISSAKNTFKLLVTFNFDKSYIPSKSKYRADFKDESVVT